VNTIAIQIDEPAWRRALPTVRDVVRRAARAAGKGTGEVTVLLTDDNVVRGLNARFREKDAATNVLAFPSAPGTGQLGDIALAFGVCAREAAEQHKTLADHLSHLIVHGVLHLTGHDHQLDDEATTMEGLERHLLASLGVSDPYAAAELVDAHG